MGYYSYFEISLYDGSDLSDDLVDAIHTISDYDFERDSSRQISSSDSIKWYDAEDHMVAISKAYPTLLLQVYRNGEESDDEVMYYYLNGVKEVFPVMKIFAPPTFISTTREFGTIKSLT